MQNILTVLALETPFPSASPSQVICAAELGAGKEWDRKGGGRGKHSPHPSNQKREPKEPEVGA